MTLVLAVCSLFAALLIPSQSGPISPPSAPGATTAEAGAQPQWTLWGAKQYALAEDGASIWIGGVGGVIQWDKATGAYRRYTSLDGLPQLEVRAIAVDAAGNRWFAGLGGLSRLDKHGNWTHYATNNSGLRANEIDALAVVGGDTLYAWHRALDGTVSRLAPDGSWHWFPNREAAVVSAYADIVARGTTLSPLWTAADSEVWAGSWVYDGAAWHERPLPYRSPVTGTVADGEGDVWAWTGGYHEVWEWRDGNWISRSVQSPYILSVATLAVDAEGEVWAGGSGSFSPYSAPRAVVRELTGENERFLGEFAPVSALLATAEGLWATGPGWLMTPGFDVVEPPDMPRYQDAWDVLAEPNGPLWLTTRPAAEFYNGALQMLDDRGTAMLEDDAWREEALGCARVTALERLGADVWFATYCHSRVPDLPRVTRRYGGVDIEYTLPPSASGEVTDIFARDARHVWFILEVVSYGRPDYALGLDDGGTPADTSDDEWQMLPTTSAAGKQSIAVDAQGQLWRGDAGGLYRYDGAAWQQVYDERAVCDIAPAADGTVFAQVAWQDGAGCETHSDRALVAHPNGTVDPSLARVEGLLSQQPDRVRSAARRNSLWTVAADGAIWHVARTYVGDELQRYSGGATTSFALPTPGGTAKRVEVDGRGAAWLVASGNLWRIEGTRIERVYAPLLSR